jgi:hypothetical protein
MTISMIQPDATVPHGSEDYSRPWKATVIATRGETRDDHDIRLCIDYCMDHVVCPCCTRQVPVTRKKSFEVTLPDLCFGVGVVLTAYVPLMDNHNALCATDHRCLAVTNTLLLDMILKLIGKKQTHNPFQFLFNAVAAA